LHTEPLIPDPTIVDGLTDVPRVWAPFIWHGREFTGDVILQPFVQLTPDQLQVTDEAGVAVDISYAPSVAPMFVVGGSVFDSTGDGDSGPLASGLERVLLTSVPASEYFRATTTFAAFGEWADTGSFDLTANVPEPATFALVALALLAVAGLRSDRRSGRTDSCHAPS
jgi:hypothetical protein